MSTDQPSSTPESSVPSPPPAQTTPAPAESPQATPVETTANADSPESPAVPEPAAPQSATPVTAAPATVANANGDAPEAATDEATGDEAKRRVRLNPTFIPSSGKGIPTLAPNVVPYDGPAAAPAAAASSEAAGVEPAASSAAAEMTPTPSPAPASGPGESVPPPRPVGPPVEIPRGADLDAGMEAEIASAMQAGPSGTTEAVDSESEEPAAEGAAPATAPPPAKSVEELKDGDRLTGVVASISGDNVFLDFGLRMTGFVSLRQCNPTKPPVVGDKLKVIFKKIDETEGLIHVNVPRGRTKVSGDWTGVSVGQAVEGMVTKSNKGGLEVTVGSLRAFLPASQVELGFVADLDTYIGQKLAVVVTEVNAARRRMVVSRKQLLIAERGAAEKEVMATLSVGDEREGVVKTLKDYGAFIDIGGVDGFLHIGQISWTRINHPSEALTVGQSVNVKVLTIDDEKKRISLGMRQLSRNPWTDAENQYPKGSKATGKVTRIEAFGAFVELEPGVEGLVHISELDHKRVKKVEEVLKLGQSCEVQIVEVDPKKKRISLSVKAMTAAPEKPKDEDFAPGQGEAYERQHKGPLKGGIGGTGAGGLFGDPKKFN